MKQRAALVDRLLAAQVDLRNRLKAALASSLRAELADLGGITLHQVEVMRPLLRGGRMTMRDVAEAAGIGPSAATQLVDRLEQRGLVERVRDPGDRRVLHVVPTARARSLARRLHAEAGRASAEALAVLDDAELAAYVEMTERITASGQRASAAQNGGRRA